jgi:hypothetical protein
VEYEFVRVCVSACVDQWYISLYSIRELSVVIFFPVKYQNYI